MDETQARIGESARALAGMAQDKQADLALVLGVSQKAVSAKLNGSISWSLRDVERLANHYGVTADVLMAGPRAWLQSFGAAGLTRPYVLAQVA